MIYNLIPVRYRNPYLLLETAVVFVGLSAMAIWMQQQHLAWYWRVPLVLLQGFWFYRFYIVGHEASHRKLFPGSRLLNDLAGSLVLLPLLTPIHVYRKIHLFHHGFNRLDDHTSALDTFETRWKPGFWVKCYYYALWYISVFMGGLFVHSLVSVLLFLFSPPALSRRISPAFNGWTWADQFRAIAGFGLGVLFHLGVYFAGGLKIYLAVLGFPMLAFAWLLSLMVYIFHYDTTKGPEVRYHVRSLPPSGFLSWVLLNFNEHATHHQHPNIPWYDLPKKRKPLPEPYATRNQKVQSYFRAIFNQLKGPVIVHKPRRP